MVLDWMIGALLSFVSAIFSLVPNWTLPTATVTGTTFGHWVGMANHYMPLPDICIVAGLGIVYAIAVSVWHFIIFVYHNIPVFGGSE
jgi:uncharacterized membrane protein